jgi:nicotinate-nucleotide pyrophosphorylase (carboxylating)
MQRGFDITQFLTAALAEDIGSGDVTGNSVIPATAQAEFAFVARTPLVVAGLIYLPELFRLVDAQVVLTEIAKDGHAVGAGTTLATVKGSARSLLAAERTALNLLQHLGGVATLTRQYVDAVAGTHAKILDTRKTIAGLRHLQKYAVTCGGGTNHRMGLYDAVMIKDNHIAVAGGVAQAVKAARASGLKIQVECDTLAQLDEALAVGVDSVLLDNMDLPMLTEGARRARAKGVWSEASGNVNLQTVRAIAETGVDAISVGKLTHSVTAVDIGLDAR